jgi:hypothetical protein
MHGKNISVNCQEYFFPKSSPVTEIDYTALSLSALSGVFVILLTASFIGALILAGEICAGQQMMTQVEWLTNRHTVHDGQIIPSPYVDEQCTAELESVLWKWGVQRLHVRPDSVLAKVIVSTK